MAELLDARSALALKARSTCFAHTNECEACRVCCAISYHGTVGGAERVFRRSAVRLEASCSA